MAIGKAQRTLLIVGEGRHEEAFLTHLKQLVVLRNGGLSVKITNARGKGALHVITWTARQMANADYDCVAALLDTDQDWNSSTEKLAKIKRVQVLKSTPCFEAMMLRLLGQPAIGAAPLLKKALAPFVKNDPTEPAHYVEHFGLERLQAGRRTEPTLDRLLTLLGR